MKEIHCLTREEYKYIIEQKILKLGYDSIPDLEELWDRASSYWDVEIVGINYFATKIIEQLQRDGIVINNLIEKIYSLPNNAFFSIEDFNYKYLDFVMQHGESGNGVTLEQQVIDLLELSYGKFIRS